jgi:peroxiredoxin (alkyl hydroperoxide reductase subunit C)
MSTLTGKAAPGFTAPAVMADNSIRHDLSLDEYRGKYVVVFFYPEDFTYVCPSEILAFDARLEEFRQRDCEVVGVSVDPEASHVDWKNTAVEDGGIGPIRYPLLADVSKEVTRAFGVLAEEGVALRATFLIDRDGIVRHSIVNDLSLGRSIDDTLRTLDALKHIDETGEVCPANWQRGKPAMEATPAGVKKYLKEFNLGS